MTQEWTPPTAAEVRALRKRLVLTQREAAQKVGRCREQWWRYEQGWQNGNVPAQNPIDKPVYLLLKTLYGKDNDD